MLPGRKGQVQAHGEYPVLPMSRGPRVALVCPLTCAVFTRKIIVSRQLSFPNLGKGRGELSPSGDPHRADHDAERETRSVVLLRHHDLSRQRDTRLDAGDDDRLAWG